LSPYGITCWRRYSADNDVADFPFGMALNDPDGGFAAHAILYNDSPDILP